MNVQSGTPLGTGMSLISFLRENMEKDALCMTRGQKEE